QLKRKNHLNANAQRRVQTRHRPPSNQQQRGERERIPPYSASQAESHRTKRNGMCTQLSERAGTAAPDTAASYTQNRTTSYNVIQQHKRERAGTAVPSNSNTQRRVHAISRERERAQPCQTPQHRTTQISSKRESESRYTRMQQLGLQPTGTPRSIVQLKSNKTKHSNNQGDSSAASYNSTATKERASGYSRIQQPKRQPPHSEYTKT
ncbi:unnamed protein product, partial [Laminaria digitata]